MNSDLRANIHCLRIVGTRRLSRDIMAMLATATASEVAEALELIVERNCKLAIEVFIDADVNVTMVRSEVIDRLMESAPSDVKLIILARIVEPPDRSSPIYGEFDQLAGF